MVQRQCGDTFELWNCPYVSEGRLEKPADINAISRKAKNTKDEPENEQMKWKKKGVEGV